MPAVICDISQDILGMDFLNKYKLGFELEYLKSPVKKSRR